MFFALMAYPISCAAALAAQSKAFARWTVL